MATTKTKKKTKSSSPGMNEAEYEWIGIQQARRGCLQITRRGRNR
jgi:hypothetical protein